MLQISKKGRDMMTPEIWMVAGAFLFMIVFMVWGKIEPCTVIMLALGFLWLTGILDTATAFGEFSGDVIVIMVFMMMCSAGLMKTDILYNITEFIKKMHGGEKTLFTVAMIAPFILCQFMGGVTALVTTVPLLIGMADANKVPRTRLILPALVGSQFGIGLFPIGFGVSLFMQKNQFLSAMDSAYRMGFWDTMFTRLPGVLLSMAFVLLIGYKLLPAVPGRCRGDIPDEVKMKRSTLPAWKSTAAYLIFLAVLVGMALSKVIGLSMAQISFAGAMLYLILGILPQREAFASVYWPVCFMVAFCVALSAAVTSTGAADLIAGMAGKFITSDTSITILCIVVFLFCSVVTQFCDNSALVYITIPIVIAACNGVGLNPLPLVCCVDLSSTASIMTPLSGPGGMVAYTMGGYSYTDMIKFGTPIILIQAIVTAVWVPFYFTVLA